MPTKFRIYEYTIFTSNEYFILCFTERKVVPKQEYFKIYGREHSDIKLKYCILHNYAIFMSFTYNISFKSGVQIQG